MPNAADTALAAGFTTLRSIAGDVVTFRGATVSAVVNWTPGAEAPPGPGLPDLDRRAKSRIEFVAGAVSPDPRVGEIVTIGTTYHRIAIATFTGLGWQLDCEVTT